jgi:tetratricopeptide (TPR) repeat protein
LRESIAVYQKLVDDVPQTPEHRRRLAICHRTLGDLLKKRQRAAEGETSHREALAILRKLVSDFPDQSDYRDGLAGAYTNLAILRNERGDPAEAKTLLTEARKHHDIVLKANPHYLDYRIHYTVCLGTLIGTQARLLEPNEAISTAEEVRDLGWDPPTNAFEAATALSGCIPLVQFHDKLDARQRKEAMQFYGDAAMNMLQVAVHGGFSDVSKVETSPYLVPLNARQDFLQLLADMRKQQQELAPSGK